ncbi:hypothetical protein PR048_002312, partial [Dryococelus australis]
MKSKVVLWAQVRGELSTRLTPARGQGRRPAEERLTRGQRARLERSPISESADVGAASGGANAEVIQELGRDQAWTSRPSSPHLHYTSRRRSSAISTLATHQGEPGSIPGRVTGFSQVVIVPDDAVGRRVFSGISRFPRYLIPALLHIHFNHRRRLSRPRLAVVSERLVCSPPTNANRAQSPAGSLPHFRTWESYGRCCWSVGFSRGSTVPPPFFHSGAAPYSFQSPSSALKTPLLEPPKSLHSLIHPPIEWAIKRDYMVQL